MSPFQILLLILVGSGSTLLLTQIVAGGSAEGGWLASASGSDSGGRLRNLSPQPYVNDGALLASTVYYGSRNSGPDRAPQRAARESDEADRRANLAAEAKEEDLAGHGRADAEEERQRRSSSNAKDHAAPDGRVAHAGAGASPRQSAASAIAANSRDEKGSADADLPLDFPKRSDVDSHKLFHDDIKMGKPWDADEGEPPRSIGSEEEENEAAAEEDPWSEPDITALDPSLVVTRNGVTHPAVAWLMSFPNR